jgi:hypothetical protein
MTMMENLDRAIARKQEEALRITEEDVEAFNAMVLADKKTYFLGLGNMQQRQLVAALTLDDLLAIKAEVQA